MPKLNLLMLLEHLEELAASNFHIAGKVLLDYEELTEIIEKIRIALPDEIREAEWISREKDRYLEQAQEEAKRILREAENYASRLVHEDQIINRAEEEANLILDDAQKQAVEIEAEARRYANQILEQLEESLDRTLKVVRKGRDELSQGND